MDFLTDFTMVPVTPEQCVRNFSDSCRGKRAELTDVQQNRQLFQILGGQFSVASVTLNSNKTSADVVAPRHDFRHRQGDWCARDREGNLPVDGSLRELAMVLVRQQLLLVRHDHLGRSRTAAVQPSVSGLTCACCMDGGALPHHNQQESMSSRGPTNPERSFGLSVGGVLCLIAAVLVWRGRIFGAELAGSVGVVLLVFGLVQPQLLKWPSALWWRFAACSATSTRAFC